MPDELTSTPVPELTVEPPTLTLNPTDVPAPAAMQPTVKTEPLPADLSENNLTPEEREMVKNFAATIDITNSNVILTYGAAAQQKIAGFSENALKSVRTKDMGKSAR